MFHKYILDVHTHTVILIYIYLFTFMAFGSLIQCELLKHFEIFLVLKGIGHTSSMVEESVCGVRVRK